MRIGLLINKIDTNGGIQKNYRLLYELFKSHGHEVYLFVLHKPKLIHVQDKNIIFLEGKYLFQKGGKLKEYIEGYGKFDLFLVNATKLKKYLKENTYYITVHNTWSKKINKNNPIKRWSKYNELKKAFLNENIIGISKGVVNDVNNVLNIRTKSSQTIYAPHDIETVRILANEKTPYNSDYIVAVGGLQKRKRFALLIHVYATIIKRFPNINLIIIGNGTERENLKSIIKSKNLETKVSLLGFKENPYPYIKNAKLLVSPSFEEGLPRVLVEALILNTPVVSTRSSTSIEEIMTNELSHYICHVDDKVDLQNKIENALTTYPNIHATSYEKFDINQIYQQYIMIAKKNHTNIKSVKD